MKNKELILKQEMAFNAVFHNKNSFGKMFNDSIDQKIIICRTHGYYLKKHQYEALVQTIKALGELSFYVYLTEGRSFDQIDNTELGPWELSVDTPYAKYETIPLVLENALYSKNGIWGLIVSHEDHGVIGGSNQFINLFKKFYPDWKQNFLNFLDMWEYNKKRYKSDLSWLPNFLEYINPPKK